MMLAYLLVHYLTPHKSNNHKAKLLHLSSLTYFMILLLLFQVSLSFLPVTGARVLGYASQISTADVVSLSNQKRVSNGLSALNYNASLSEAAKKKGEHMLANDYWAHVAPDGTEPWYFFNTVGYKYKYAGENLARDFSNASTAVDAWMASPSHKENLLSSKYTEIGVAVVEGDLAGVDTTIIVQLFGTQVSGSQVPIAQANTTVPSVTKAPVPTVAQSPTPTLTLTPTPEPTYSSEFIASTELSPVSTQGSSDFLVSPFDSTRAISLSVVGLLSVATVVDGLMIATRRIPRIAGKSFAHFAFLGMIILIVLVARAGEIL